MTQNNIPTTPDWKEFSTDQPIVQVPLPIGIHTLELIVEDDRGQKSAPAYVTITVLANKQPTIQGIEFNPAPPRQGWVGILTIKGDNLENASALTFDPPDTELIVVTGSLRSTQTTVTAEVRIGENVVPGPRQVSVTTPLGEAQSQFTIQAGSPVITSITKNGQPASGQQGEANISITINGKFLSDASSVIFAPPGSNLNITFTRPTENAKILATVSIGKDVAPGKYTLSVTTPGGVANSNNITGDLGNFTVVLPAPFIDHIDPDHGDVDTTETYHIMGYIPEPTKIQVAGKDITATIDPNTSTNENLVVSIKIKLLAEPGSRAFSVITSSGITVSSTFNIMLPPPVIEKVDPPTINAETGSGSTTITGKYLIRIKQIKFEERFPREVLWKSVSWISNIKSTDSSDGKSLGVAFTITGKPPAIQPNYRILVEAEGGTVYKTVVFS